MKLDTKGIVVSVLTALSISINALIEEKEKGVFSIDVFKIFWCLMEGFMGTFLVIVFTVVFLKGFFSKELNSIESDNTNFPDMYLVMICSPLLIYNLLNIFVSMEFH